MRNFLSKVTVVSLGSLLILGLFAKMANSQVRINFDDIRNNDIIGGDQLNIDDDFLDITIDESNTQFGGQGNDNSVTNSDDNSTNNSFFSNTTEASPRTIVLPNFIGDNYSNVFSVDGCSSPTTQLSFSGGTIGFSGEDTYLGLGLSIPLERPLDCAEQARKQYELVVIPQCIQWLRAGVSVDIPHISEICNQVRID